MSLGTIFVATCPCHCKLQRNQRQSVTISHSLQKFYCVFSASSNNWKTNFVMHLVPVQTIGIQILVQCKVSIVDRPSSVQSHGLQYELNARGVSSPVPVGALREVVGLSLSAICVATCPCHCKLQRNQLQSVTISHSLQKFYCVFSASSNNWKTNFVMHLVPVQTIGIQILKKRKKSCLRFGFSQNQCTDQKTG